MSFVDRRAFLSLTTGATALLLARPTSVWARSRPASDLTRLTLHEAATLVRAREVSPVELTKACLARIEQYDSKINAFITVTAKHALAQAQAAEREILQGHWRGPLHGIPIALKDNIDIAGIRTTAASAVFVDRVPTEDADVVKRLKQAGAVLLGKLNLSEFAIGVGSVDSFWGPVHNPWAFDHESGGSSGGSAAAIAADFCFGALGTDTGGSIRIPASFCGVVGLKPSYGLVSNSGVIPVADSLDHVGPLCKTVLDTALLLQNIAGYDPDWTGSVDVKLPDYAALIREDSAPPRLGIPRAYFFDNLDPQVAQLFDAALENLSTLATLISNDIAVPQHFIDLDVLLAELFAYHAPLFERAAGLYQPFLRKILASGLQKSEIKISGADYVSAHRALQEARRHAAEIFNDEIDLLVMPTWKDSPMTIEARSEWQQSIGSAGPELLNTSPFNVLGLPAISIPCGYTKGGLPVGLQIVGRPFGEAKLLAVRARLRTGDRVAFAQTEIVMMPNTVIDGGIGL